MPKKSNYEIAKKDKLKTPEWAKGGTAAPKENFLLKPLPFTVTRLHLLIVIAVTFFIVFITQNIVSNSKVKKALEAQNIVHEAELDELISEKRLALNLSKPLPRWLLENVDNPETYDPRHPGRNYFRLCQVPSEFAEAYTRFLALNNVRTLAKPVENKNDLISVYAIDYGFTATEQNGETYRQYRDMLASLSAAWKRETGRYDPTSSGILSELYTGPATE